MVYGLLQLLVVLLVFGIVWWASQQIPLPPPVKVVVSVIIAIVACFVLLDFVGVVDLGHARMWRFG